MSRRRLQFQRELRKAGGPDAIGKIVPRKAVSKVTGAVGTVSISARKFNRWSAWSARKP